MCRFYDVYSFALNCQIFGDDDYTRIFNSAIDHIFLILYRVTVLVDFFVFDKEKCIIVQRKR